MKTERQRFAVATHDALASTGKGRTHRKSRNKKRGNLGVRDKEKGAKQIDSLNFILNLLFKFLNEFKI